jgi:two-component system, cell cycle response regulator
VPTRPRPSPKQIKSSAYSGSVPWFARELEPLLAIAIATLDEDGKLIEANAGFLKVIGIEASSMRRARTAQFFIQPNFATLVRQNDGADGEIHSGLLTLGDYSGRTRTLRARVWRVGRRLRVLAEHDVAELERLADTVLELNSDYAQAQFDLVQVNLKLQQREAQIVASSLTDPLTRVGNRRLLEQALASETSRFERTGEALSAFIADLDHFKRVNDTYGHEAGDNVLAGFGGLLRGSTRATDIVVRFGGEEFVVLMPDTNLEKAASVAERIREALAGCQLEPLTHAVTASFGVAEMVPGEQGSAMLRRADNALYEAKRAGRNRVATG